MKKRKDGRFEGKYYYGGKSKSIYGNTEEEVEDKLKKINAEIELGMYFEPSKMKLEDWMQMWLFDYKRNSIKPKTLASYADLIRLHINPKLGFLTLDKLNTITIQKFINDMKVSPRTIKYIHIVLKMALKYAVNVGMLMKNPAENISLPRQIKKDIQILDKEDISKFLEEIKNNRYCTVFLLALTTGMRRGEILALRWSDINFDKGLINVSRTIDRVKVFDEANTYCTLLEGTCKTDKSRRVLPILPSALSSLKAIYMRNTTEALTRGEKVSNDSHVFVTQTGKNLSPRNLLRCLKTILTNAKISHIKFHALRHTFATIGMESGIELKTMQELLGHSSITITADIYTHVQIHQKREAIKKLKQVF